VSHGFQMVANIHMLRCHAEARLSLAWLPKRN
jgi:hypothetical protein